MTSSGYRDRVSLLAMETRSHEKYAFAHVVYEMPGICDDERLIWGSDLGRFHAELVDVAKHIDDLFGDHYDWCFHRAEQPGLDDYFEDEARELLELLLKTQEYTRSDVMRRMVHFRMNRQAELIRHGKGDFEGVRSWVELFNSYIDSALYVADDGPTAWIRIERAKEFAPYLMECLLRRASPDRGGRTFGEFVPFQSRLEQLVQWVNMEDWPRSDVAFGAFLEWIELFDLSLNNRY